MGNVLCIVPRDPENEIDRGRDRAVRRIRHFIHHRQRAGVERQPERQPSRPEPANSRRCAASTPPSTTKMTGDEEDFSLPCVEAVLDLFPDICPDFLSRIAEEKEYDREAVTTHILDLVEAGSPYPKKPNLKRKRRDSDAKDDGEDEAVKVAKKFDNEDYRQRAKHPSYLRLSKVLLQQSFPKVTQKDIATFLRKNDNCLLPTFVALDKSVEQEDEDGPPLKLKKVATKSIAQYQPNALGEAIDGTLIEGEKEALEEYRAAVAIHRAQGQKRDAERQRQRAEEENLRKATEEGSVKDCECCFAECALNRMVHCDGSTFHWFCKDCPRRMAESQVGLSKYELQCMSVDGCTAGFSRDQRDQFLDEKVTKALERIEQEAVLRLAGIENLETCPFCPFAAEYPPVEVNKEFRCQNPGCEEVSCRLCRKVTHIPKTCEEAEKENGHSARRIIEEAMSAAMIRTCNKCGTPFIKESGCNKMTCSRPGCRNIQCYVCHKSCDYKHFNDTSRGGKPGNCPLFESAEQRHDNEVRDAEERARKQVEEENPDVAADLLEIKLSDRVKADEKRRKDADAMQHRGMPVAFPGQGQANRHGPAPVVGELDWAGLPRQAGRNWGIGILGFPGPFPLDPLEGMGPNFAGEPRELPVPQELPNAARMPPRDVPWNFAYPPPIGDQARPFLAQYGVGARARARILQLARKGAPAERAAGPAAGGGRAADAQGGNPNPNVADAANKGHGAAPQGIKRAPQRYQADPVAAPFALHPGMPLPPYLGPQAGPRQVGVGDHVDAPARPLLNLPQFPVGDDGPVPDLQEAAAAAAMAVPAFRFHDARMIGRAMHGALVAQPAYQIHAHGEQPDQNPPAAAPPALHRPARRHRRGPAIAYPAPAQPGDAGMQHYYY